MPAFSYKSSDISHNAPVQTHLTLTHTAPPHARSQRMHSDHMDTDPFGRHLHQEAKDYTCGQPSNTHISWKTPSDNRQRLNSLARCSTACSMRGHTTEHSQHTKGRDDPTKEETREQMHTPCEWHNDKEEDIHMPFLSSLDLCVAELGGVSRGGKKAFCVFQQLCMKAH